MVSADESDEKIKSIEESRKMKYTIKNVVKNKIVNFDSGRIKKKKNNSV